jgi:hypothetical protein
MGLHSVAKSIFGVIEFLVLIAARHDSALSNDRTFTKNVVMNE